VTTPTASSASFTRSTSIATNPRWFSAAEVFERVSFAHAIAAVQNALNEGLDPAADFARGILELTNGQLLLMPSQSADFVGIKVASVAPGNAALGKDRIQGTYLLMDAATLTPIAALDGTAVTTLRTPAVSAAAAAFLAPTEADHLLIFGSGPQAWGHAQAMAAIRPLTRITIVARNVTRAEALAERLRRPGCSAGVGTAADVAHASLIVCATTARTPVFDSNLLAADTCVVAVGSHEPEARELDTALMHRAQVVVEDQAVALREAGDVMIAFAEGQLDPASLVPLKNIVTGAVAVDYTRPRVFKSSGMSWEDLAVATAVYRAD
jgi:ornithine cyclodeaminase